MVKKVFCYAEQFTLNLVASVQAISTVGVTILPPSENEPALSPKDRLAELLARDGIGDALAFARSFSDTREHSHLWCMIGDHASEKLMFQIAEYAYTRAFGPRIRMNLIF